nr:thiamine-phosphate kinase [Aquabacterium sp.]
GDDLWVSGFPGEARLALEAFRGSLHPGLSTEAFEVTRLAMERPDPRVALGVGLRGLATAAIDVSDGLLGDLGHVLRRSCVGVSLCLDDLPVSPWLATRSPDERLDCILAGGDDYELLFTAPPAQRERVVQLGAELGLVLSRIGQIEAEPGLRLWRGASAVAEPAEGREAVPNRWTSFDHFKGAA